MTTGANFVFGVGGSFFSTWRLGRLRSVKYIDGPIFGLDAGLMLGMESSAVISVKEEKCNECES